MPTQSLPAASLRTADRLPAARVLVQVAIYLIYKVLWPLRKASPGAESSFLPALREVRGGGSRSAGQTLGAGGDLIVARNWRSAYRDEMLACGAAIPDGIPSE